MNDEMRRAVNSFKFAVICFSLVVIISFGMLTWIITVKLPGIVYTQVSAAFTDNLETP